MKRNEAEELSVIQRTRDLIFWTVPMVNRLPKSFKYSLGDRLVETLFEMLETLIEAKYAKSKIDSLNSANVRLDVVRAHMRLLLDFKLIDGRRFFHASELIYNVGVEIGSWLKQQRNEETRKPLATGD